MARRIPTALAWAILVAGCGHEDPLRPVRTASRPEGPGDPVAATVDGEPIYLSRVRALARETGRGEREVLDGMVDMTLLAHEAERRGLLDGPGARKVWKKSLAQAILAQRVEARTGEDDVTVEDIRAYYVANFAGKGRLLEDAWQDIWKMLVIERRRKLYDELIAGIRSRVEVRIDQESLARYLGVTGDRER